MRHNAAPSVSAASSQGGVAVGCLCVDAGVSVRLSHRRRSSRLSTPSPSSSSSRARASGARALARVRAASRGRDRFEEPQPHVHRGFQVSQRASCRCVVADPALARRWRCSSSTPSSPPGRSSARPLRTRRRPGARHSAPQAYVLGPMDAPRYHFYMAELFPSSNTTDQARCRPARAPAHAQAPTDVRVRRRWRS